MMQPVISQGPASRRRRVPGAGSAPVSPDAVLPSRRVTAAHERAAERLGDQQRRFRLLRWMLLGAVLAGTLTASPAPGLDGRHLGVSVALAAFAVCLWCRLPTAVRSRGLLAEEVPAIVEVSGMGVAALVLAWFQPQAGAELAVAGTVFTAGARLSRRPMVAVVVPLAVGLAAIFATAPGLNAEDVVSSVLFCVVLAVVAVLVRQARAGQEQTEVLLARLEDARDSEVAAAGVAERARVAREIHDVLAHSLSGLALQLEGARKLAERDDASEALRQVLDRSATLAKEGLGDARRAVNALRTDAVASLDQLPALVAHYHDDLGLPVQLVVEGAARALSPEASVALYRAAGEGLTNVVRHAPGASTTVTLRWKPAEVHLVVENGPGAAPGLAPAGPGWGIAGVGERVAHLGGTAVAGPAGAGWQLRVTVPA